MKRGKEEEKEDVWNRLREMACFALSGFGFFETSLVTCTYNRAKNASIIRQGVTDKDRYWDSGLRAPIGDRVSHDGAALSFGTILGGAQNDESLLLVGCGSLAVHAYDAIAPMPRNPK